MIYAIDRPINKYNIKGFDIEHIFGGNEEYTALFTLTSPTMFEFESLIAPPGFEPQFLYHDETLTSTLECKVGGRTVAELLRVLNPMNVTLAFEGNKEDVAKLPIADKFKEKAVHYLLMVMYARSAVWAEKYNSLAAASGSVFKLVPVTIPKGVSGLRKAFQEVANVTVSK